MKFSEIIGHKNVIQRLQVMTESRKLPHALLFHGPSGIGKTNVARAFIQYLNCENPVNGDACGRCAGCLQTEKLNNPDVRYVFPVVKKGKYALSSDFSEEWQEFISRYPYMPIEKWLEIIDAGNSRPVIYVDESEEIIRISSLSAYGKGRKIFLIWLPEKMNLETANKLLKVIEEPHSDTLFILVSNDAGSIIPTVRSRLQAIEFSPLEESDIIDFICKSGKTYEESVALARIAGGNMNKASQLIERDGEIKDFMSDFIQMMRGCYSRNLPLLKSLSDKFAGYGREKSLRALEYFARMLRESFISNLKSPELEAMTPEEKAFVSKFGPFINVANIEEMLKQTDRAHKDISRNANQKIVWFDLLLEFTRLIRTAPGGPKS